MPENTYSPNSASLAEQMGQLSLIEDLSGSQIASFFAGGVMPPTPRLRRQHARIYDSESVSHSNEFLTKPF